MNHVIVISPDKKFLKIMPNTDLDTAKEFLDDRIEYDFFLMEGSIIPESEKFLEITLEDIEFNDQLILTTDDYRTYIMYMGVKTYPFSDSSKLHNFSFFIGSRPNENSL